VARVEIPRKCGPNVTRRNHEKYYPIRDLETGWGGRTRTTEWRLEKTVPSHIFEAQFQQNPLYGGSGMCSVDRLVRFRERPPFMYTVHSWDVAATKNAATGPSA
jgi:hypothetical protein